MRAHSLALLIFPNIWNSATGKGREELRIFLFPHFAGSCLFRKAVSNEPLVQVTEDLITQLWSCDIGYRAPTFEGIELL